MGITDTPETERDWLELHIRALFVHDDRSRIATLNALDGGRAPRFFLGRTPDGNRWRNRDDVPDAVAVQLEALCEDEPAPADPREPPLHDADYRQVLATHAPIPEVWAGPAYRFPVDLPPPIDGVVRLTASTAALLRDGDLEPWLEDIGQSEPLMALVQDGRAVSICGSVRITPEAHEAGVETSAAARGHGFAVAVVKAWASAVRELGAEPLYSTSWENTASQAVARKLRLIPYAADYWLT
ncbi:MAG: GNAT family N-acetyltransferase [Chloroflexi bacterium]|nr:GNAT family N-acetyltransferase [Chloroflexota bacterium]